MVVMEDTEQQVAQIMVEEEVVDILEAELVALITSKLRDIEQEVLDHTTLEQIKTIVGESIQAMDQ